ncbi:MAG: MiaB/RimO family radical SAM methylthiotransferase [Gemmatimonadota bacterium]|nr:MiaB/RimO family radical SAM methylthiotransferase [Gemmatimonadota bacterium]
MRPTQHDGERHPAGVWLHTFGCKANQYDTERMRQELEARGALALDDPATARVAVLNTCTVTERADHEAARLVRRLGRRHPDLRIVVAGCSSALRADRYRAMPEVAAVVAGHDPVAVAVAAEPDLDLARTDEEPIGAPLLRTNRRGTRGWLKIQDGCDRRCSFCATRLARGASRSRAADEVVAEARLLASSHGEIVLTGIHIGHYGRDGAETPTLAKLVARLLDEVPEVRFRLGSIEATEIEDPLVDLLARPGGRLAPHLHVPLQSGSDAVLRRMRRWHTRDAYRRRVREIAVRLGPFGLGADVIAGFPGETAADHAATRDLLEELPFTYLHVFPWSPRSGTIAASLPDRVTPDVATVRAGELREIGVRKGTAYAGARAGGDALVAVETAATGLTGDYLRVRLAAGAAPGTLLRVRLRAGPAGLRGEPGRTGRAALPVLAAAPA